MASLIPSYSRTARLFDFSRISFSITFIMFSLVCLVSIIVSYAIDDNVFEADFELVDALLG